MLYDRISEDNSLLWPTGVTLNLDEKMNLKLALLKIHENEDFEEILFWGKIKGTTRDYYIALTLNYKGHYEFPHKRFFWCTSQNWKFAELPAINPNDKELVERFNINFAGEPEKVYVEAPPEAEEEQKEDEEGRRWSGGSAAGRIFLRHVVVLVQPDEQFVCDHASLFFDVRYVAVHVLHVDVRRDENRSSSSSTGVRSVFCAGKRSSRGLV